MDLNDVKLLHLFKSFTVGGVEKSTILYSNHLSHDVKFIGIFACKGTYDHSNIVSEVVHQFHPPGNIRLNPATCLFYCIRIILLIRRHGINVVNYHHRVYLPVVWMVKLFCPNVRIIYTAHNYFDDALNYFITADRIVAVSEAILRDLLRHGRKNIVLILHGVEIRPPAPHRASELNVGYVGRLEPYKGILPLLHAMEYVVEKNSHVKLILRGEGSLTAGIHRQITSLHLAENVTVAPPTLRDEDIYGDIDLLILPSLALEGFGLVLIEAMRNGIPVAGSNTTGINEIIIDGYNGRLFAPDNPVEMAAVILDIFFDDAKRTMYVTNALRTLSEKYSLPRYLSAYAAILRSL